MLWPEVGFGSQKNCTTRKNTSIGMMRYLNFVPGSEKIFKLKGHEEKFVKDMTTAQMTEIFTDVKKNLTKAHSRDYYV